MSLRTEAVLRTRECLSLEWTLSLAEPIAGGTLWSTPWWAQRCESEPGGFRAGPCACGPSPWLCSPSGIARPRAPLPTLCALGLPAGLRTFERYFASTQNCFSLYSQLQEERTPMIRFYFRILWGLASILIQNPLAIRLTLLETSLLGLHISLSDRLLHHITLAWK